jgi:hypothetical protein
VHVIAMEPRDRTQIRPSRMIVLYRTGRRFKPRCNN